MGEGRSVTLSGPIIVFQLSVIIGVLILIFLEIQEEKGPGPKHKK